MGGGFQETGRSGSYGGRQREHAWRWGHFWQWGCFWQWGYRLAWLWLLAATLTSWWLHPLSPGPLHFETPWFTPHLVLLVTLLGFGFLARRRFEARGTAGPLYLIFGLVFVLAHRHFGTNELAGILLLFLPWTVAVVLADGDPTSGSSGTQHRVLGVGRSAQRWMAGFASLLFLGMLYDTSSRSGLGAALLVLPPMLWCLGRWARRILMTGAAAGGLWLLWGGWERWLEFFVFDSKGQGLTLYTFLTGRPHIWQRHAQAVLDMPFTGLGLGASEPVVKGLYPLSRFESIVAVEDAHNLFLHVACELGLPALLAVGTLLAIASRQLVVRWRHAEEGAERAWVLGIGAGLTAYLTYGLVDVVAFGRLGSVPFWWLLGLACQRPLPATQTQTETAKETQMQTAHTSPLQGSVMRPALAALAVLVMLVVWIQRPRIGFNLAILHSARALLVDPGQQPDALEDMQQQAKSFCHGHYFVGRLTDALGRSAQRDAAYRQLFHCTDSLDDLVAFLLPDHVELAQDAYRQHPQSAAAHLWRARQLAKGNDTDRHQARILFRTALDLDSSNGRAWVELGHVLYHHNRREALIAYAEACERGDYYGQGCWQAGATARELGDLEAAIGYYRTSRMPGSHAFAQGLEAQWRRQQEAAVASETPLTP